MTTGDGPALDDVRAAMARHDWRGAYDAVSAGTFTDDPRLEADRLDLLADACWWLGRLDECTRARESAYRRFEDAGDDRRAGECAVWLYEHHSFAARPVIAAAWLRRARRRLHRDEECEPYGALLLREAEAAHGQGDLDGALLTATRVVELGRRLGSFELEAEALQAAGRVLIDQGHVREGLDRLDEAMLFVLDGRLRPYSVGKIYCSLIGACEDVGDFDRAAEWTEATQRWADEHPLCIFPGICRVHRAIVLKRRGDLDEAQREAARACEELRGSRPVATAAAWAEVGDICRRLGQLEQAEAAFAKAQEISGGPCSALALLRLAQGNAAAAHTLIERCLEATTAPLARASLLPSYVQIAVAVEDLESATGAVDELAAILDRIESPGGQAALRASRGRLLLARHDARAARAALQDALERWRALDVPYEAATTQTLLAESLRQCGDDEGAAAAFNAAAALFDQIGARMAPADASSSDRGADSAPCGLTDREVEVLRLVAAGLTNSDIAAALFLSVKTISRHLSNIFTKIGVSTRAAATAFAFEHRLVERQRTA